MKKVITIIALFFLPMPILAGDDDLIQTTAEQICEISSSKSRSRIAVYTFTDSEDKETDETVRYTTDIISCVLSCKNIKVIDPTKIKEVMQEQEKGLIGIVDDETAPETGKLLGADALVFGQVGDKTIQIRLIDAETGEILGACVQESGKNKKAVVKVEKISSKKSKHEFRKSQLRRQLDMLFRMKPGVFLFMTSTKDELEKYKALNPKGYGRIEKLLKRSSKRKKNKFFESRKTVLSLRETDKQFDKRIKDGIEKIFSNGGNSHKKRVPGRRRR